MKYKRDHLFKKTFPTREKKIKITIQNLCEDIHNIKSLSLKCPIAKGIVYQHGKFSPIKKNNFFCLIHDSNFSSIRHLYKMKISI